MTFQGYLKKLQNEEVILISTSGLKCQGKVESVEEDFLILLTEEVNHEDNKPVTSYKLTSIPLANIAALVE